MKYFLSNADKWRLLRPFNYAAQFLADASRHLEGAEERIRSGELDAADEDMRDLLECIRRAEAEAQGARRVLQIERHRLRSRQSSEAGLSVSRHAGEERSA